ncbi:MAG: lipopolysaccharide heptosyltransferase II [Candidatus Omnitrophica bacterium]|nr:lipopolysaccharide heptosyltransferase II [Candidatus Omnitrophota bacterium]
MTRGSQKRILVFNVNWLGDVLFSTAAIRNIRYNFPGSFIACVVPPRCYPVLKGNPHVDEILIFDEEERHKGALGQLGFVKALKDRKFDTVFLFHRSFTRALICRLADIPERIGYHTKKRGFLMAKKILPPAPESLHRIDYYLNILTQSGLKVEDRQLEFYVEDEDRRYIRQLLEQKGVSSKAPLVLVNPGGNWMPKRWPPEHWARLCDMLIEAQAQVVIAGSLQDAPLAETIAGSMKEKPVILSGMMNLKQLGALCLDADCVITADSGPLHIAASLNAKKIIALFGPTSVSVTGPQPAKNAVILQKDTGCKIPCYQVHCKDNRCMKAITPEEVFKAFKERQKQ